MRNNINIKKLFDEILDKKFSKNMIAGYDPLEVDMFLDNVRAHLVSLHHFVTELETTIRNKDAEINKLQQKISSKDETIRKQQYSIESYIKDGYQNQRWAKEIGDIRTTLSELMDGKNK